MCSRYGLFDSDSEFDEDEDDGRSQVRMQEKTQSKMQKQPPKQAHTGVLDKAVPVRQGYGLFDEDEVMDDSGSDQTGMLTVPCCSASIAF